MKHNGFTLFEMLFTSSIAATLMAIAIPEFQNLYINHQIYSATNQLRSTLQLARKESITQRKNLVLCASSDAATCDHNWSNGYLLFVDQDNNNAFDPTIDHILQYKNNPQTDLTIHWRSFRGDQPIRFIPAGITFHFNGTFVICYQNKQQFAKALFMAKTGRVQTSMDNNADGIDEMRDGSNIQCR